MAHEILVSPHPAIAHMRIYSTLMLEDMMCDDELGLSESPRAVLCDLIDMEVWLPEGFIEGARKSFFVHPHMLHLALVLTSPMLRSVALMISKLTSQRDKLTIHPTVAAAEAHLLGVLRRQALLSPSSERRP